MEPEVALKCKWGIRPDQRVALGESAATGHGAAASVGSLNELSSEGEDAKLAVGPVRNSDHASTVFDGERPCLGGGGDSCTATSLVDAEGPVQLSSSGIASESAQATKSTLKAAITAAANAGLQINDTLDDNCAPAPEEETQDEARETGQLPAQLLISTLQLRDDDLARLLRLSLEDRPWLRTPVSEALSSLKPSKKPTEGFGGDFAPVESSSSAR